MDLEKGFSAQGMGGYGITLDDKYQVKILLCYLLLKLKKRVGPQQLYEIAVGSGILNYFFYTEAVGEMESEGLAVLEEEGYRLEEKGRLCADLCGRYVLRSFREKLLREALLYFSRIRRENEIECICTPSENGYLVKCRVPDVAEDLMELTLFAPDLEQAELLKAQIMKNPTGLYARIMGYAMNLQEEEPDLDI